MADLSLPLATPGSITPRGPKPPTFAAGIGATARRAAEEFEAVFLSQMLKPMFENLTAESPFGGGLAEDIWRSLQVDELGKAITQAGGIGLADTVAREMLTLQDVQGGPTP